MANFNKVFLIGNLTRDPELRYTPNGTAVVDLGMAVNRTWTSQGGERREETCFVTLRAWARSAEVISEYCRKGRPLFVEGHLRTDSWEGRDGQKRSKLVVVVDRFQFLGGPRPDEGPGTRGRGGPGIPRGRRHTVLSGVESWPEDSRDPDASGMGPSAGSVAPAGDP